MADDEKGEKQLQLTEQVHNCLQILQQAIPRLTTPWPFAEPQRVDFYHIVGSDNRFSSLRDLRLTNYDGSPKASFKLDGADFKLVFPFLVSLLADPPASVPETVSHWDEHPQYPVEDWQYAVANGDTRQGYQDWCASQEEMAQDDKDTGRAE